MFDDLPDVPEQPKIAVVQSLDLILYVDCLPVKGVIGVLPLEDLIEAKAKPICEEFKVTDVREVDFGKGTRALIAAFKKDPPVGSYSVSMSGLGALVVDALTPVAKIVVRGMR
jgi:hypothetical protein